MFGRFSVSANELQAPIRVLRKTGPDFLSVNYKVVAVTNCFCIERRQVTAGVGFREALTPDLFTGKDRGEISRLLLRSADGDYGWADERKSDRADQRRS